MEKNSYDSYTFFSEVVIAWKNIDTREADIFLCGDKVWKVFHSFILPEMRDECHIEALSELRSDYLTIPKRKLYLDYEYYGYLMDNAGTPLDKYWEDNDLSRQVKVYILAKVKDIVEYLKGLGLIHSDIRIPNIMLDFKDDKLIVRLGDINGMIFPDSKVYHLNYLHEAWYHYYADIKVIDKLALDLITFILINFDEKEYRDIVNAFESTLEGSKDSKYFIDETRYLLKQDKGYFKDEESFFIKRNIANYNQDKKLTLPNTYLIDCLK